GKLRLSVRAFSEWKEVPLERRARLMASAGAVLRNNKRKLAEIITREMGKVIAQAEAEIAKCALVCDYYADNAEKYLQNEPLDGSEGEAFIAYDPLGPVLAIMPWNFPFWQVFRFAAPNLTVGNVGLLKHASNVPQCSLAIEEVFREAGFPEGVFQSLLISSSKMEDVIGKDEIQAVTLTGSEDAGRKVAEKAGAGLKKT